MNKYYIGLLDAMLHVDDVHTRTANYNGASIDLGSGFAPSGIGARMGMVVTADAVDQTTGDETYTFTLEESDDNATFTPCGPAVTMDAPAAITVPGFVSKRYVRVSLVVAGTTPSINYQADLTVLD